MNREVLRVCEAVREAGGRAMLVGGGVRDHLFGIESKDFDIEVYGLAPARLREVLETIAPVNAVGEHFSVYKLVFYDSNSDESLKSEVTDFKSPPAKRFEIDVSLPRRESKSGRGHRGFIIEGDPEMSFEEAARRRDFTINAILYDPLTDEIIDPFCGARDIKLRLLRAVAADTFVEDSLRVLRAVQLAARFKMKVEPATMGLCRSIDLSDLPRERIWGEFEKLLTMSEQPSIGLETALELGVLDKLFPALGALATRNGRKPSAGMDAFAHTKASLDQAVKLTRDLPREKRITVMLAVLCHDLAAGDSSDAALSILNRLGVHSLGGYDVRSAVLALVTEHLKPAQFYDDRERVTDGDFRRLAQKLDLDLLYRVAAACALAEGAGASSIKQDWFLEKVRALGLETGAPEPLLRGRDLIKAGFAPGPMMGEVLRRVYDLQLDGRVKSLEEALAIARQMK